jgi:beta-glucosidase
MIRFPDHFLWGTATAAHQIEGGNVNNDWWEFEHDPTSGCVDVSGDACDSFNRYPEDIALVADLGLGAYRFSLEWSRIEPEEGEFSLVALEHYRRMAATCREHGLLPVVTFHHFTHPRWLARAGAWEAPHAPDRFARYCQRVTAHLADLMSPTWWPPWDGASGSSRPGCETGTAGTWSTRPWSRPTARGWTPSGRDRRARRWG